MSLAEPIISRQVGWMPCVACKDSKRLVGRMWLGVHRNGVDNFVTCPACNGTGQVARFKVFSLITGKEIDYEKYGQPTGVNNEQRICVAGR